MSDAGKILKDIKEKDVRYVDLRFTDTKGRMQHVTFDIDLVDDDKDIFRIATQFFDQHLGHAADDGLLLVGRGYAFGDFHSDDGHWILLFAGDAQGVGSMRTEGAERVLGP